MKTKKWIWLLIAVFGLSFYACSDSDDGVRIGNVSQTLCKDLDARSTIGHPWGKQSVTYEVKEGMLYITLVNYRMNCAAEGADVKIQHNDSNNEIILTPFDLGKSLADCICPIDITATVAGLEYGETYQCTIEHMDLSFSFTCKNGVKGTVEE